MHFSRRLFERFFWRQRVMSGREKFEKWFLDSRSGFWCRIGLLTTPVIVYPLSSIFINGPFVGKTFKWRYSVEEKMPEHLQKLIDEEYNRYLDINQRKKIDSVVTFHLQDNYVQTDSIVKGSMSTRAGGARIALPFFMRFQSVDEALEYCKQKMEPLNLLKAVACIIWDSDLGRDIINTFVLSDEAKRFIIYRDLKSCENYQALVNAPLIIAAYTIFSSFFTYVIHKYAFHKNPTAVKFLLLYAFFTSGAVFGAIQYHKFYYYSTGYFSDEQSALRSLGHTNGGMEYYMKMLRRHRLLREVLDKGHDLFTPAGNLKGIGLNYVFRYGKLKDMTHENDEIAPAYEGDDF